VSLTLIPVSKEFVFDPPTLSLAVGRAQVALAANSPRERSLSIVVCRIETLESIYFYVSNAMYEKWVKHNLTNSEPLATELVIVSDDNH